MRREARAAVDGALEPGRRVGVHRRRVGGLTGPLGPGRRPGGRRRSAGAGRSGRRPGRRAGASNASAARRLSTRRSPGDTSARAASRTREWAKRRAAVAVGADQAGVGRRRQVVEHVVERSLERRRQHRRRRSPRRARPPPAGSGWRAGGAGRSAGPAPSGPPRGRRCASGRHRTRGPSPRSSRSTSVMKKGLPPVCRHTAATRSGSTRAVARRRGQQAADLLGRQAAEVDHDGAAGQGVELAAPHGGQHHQAVLLGVGGEEVDEGQRLVVAPLQVVEHDHGRIGVVQPRPGGGRRRRRAGSGRRRSRPGA